MVFNIFPNKPSEILETIGDPSLAADRMFGIDQRYSGSDVDHVIPLEGTLPVPISSGKKTDLKPFPVGDDLAAAQESGRLKSTELLVKIDPMGDQKVSLWLNGKHLRGVKRRNEWIAVSPPVDAVKQGLNQLSLVVGDIGSSLTNLSVTDVQLWVRYSA